MDLEAALSPQPFHDKRARHAPVDRDQTMSPPAALSGVIDLLRAPGGVNLDEVTIALQSLSVDDEALGEAISADYRAYVRTLLYRDDQCELLALTWLPGQRSPVHDHDDSTSVMRVVSGVATETLYRRREYGAAKRQSMTRELRPGVVMRLPADTLHSLANTADVPLVTLHVYAPPLSHG
jgi:cysteine dioxygenase